MIVKSRSIQRILSPSFVPCPAAYLTSTIITSPHVGNPWPSTMRTPVARRKLSKSTPSICRKPSALPPPNSTCCATGVTSRTPGVARASSSSDTGSVTDKVANEIPPWPFRRNIIAPARVASRRPRSRRFPRTSPTVSTTRITPIATPQTLASVRPGRCVRFEATRLFILLRYGESGRIITPARETRRRKLLDQFIVELEEAIRHDPPLILLRRPARPRQPVFTRRRVVEDRSRRRRERGAVRLGQPGVGLVGVGEHAAGVRRDKRQSGRHCFERRDAERLARVRMNEGVAVCVKT